MLLLRLRLLCGATLRLRKPFGVRERESVLVVVRVIERHESRPLRVLRSCSCCCSRSGGRVGVGVGVRSIIIRGVVAYAHALTCLVARPPRCAASWRVWSKMCRGPGELSVCVVGVWCVWVARVHTTRFVSRKGEGERQASSSSATRSTCPYHTNTRRPAQATHSRPPHPTHTWTGSSGPAGRRRCGCAPPESFLALLFLSATRLPQSFCAPCLP